MEISELSLKVLSRLQELKLVPEASKVHFEEVRKSLEFSLQDFYRAAENFLAEDFGELCENDKKRVRGHLSGMLGKVVELNRILLALEKGLAQVMHHLPEEALGD